jgi:hypothetical protein
VDLRRKNLWYTLFDYFGVISATSVGRSFLRGAVFLNEFGVELAESVADGHYVVLRRQEGSPEVEGALHLQK